MPRTYRIDLGGFPSSAAIRSLESSVEEVPVVSVSVSASSLMLAKNYCSDPPEPPEKASYEATLAAEIVQMESAEAGWRFAVAEGCSPLVVGFGV